MSCLLLDAEDLAKVSVRPGGGPFAESLFSLRLLRQRHPSSFAAGWVRAVRARLGPSSNPPIMLGALQLLFDPHMVVWQGPAIDEAIVWLEKASDERRPQGSDGWIRFAQTVAPAMRSWLRDLLEGEPGAARELAQSFLDYYVRAVDPYWKRIRSHLDTERARCGRVMAEGGLERLLSSLHPRVRWRPPTLEVVTGRERGPRPGSSSGPDPSCGVGQGPVSYVLDGRSLVLVPSVFSMDVPRVLFSEDDPTLPAVLVYPVLRQIDDASSLWAPQAAVDRSALAKLLGRTKAAALTAIADSCSTTELAHRVGVAAATASHHANVLRGAGLIVSRRAGNTVVHRLTSLGADLLGTGASAAG